MNRRDFLQGVGLAWLGLRAGDLTAARARPKHWMWMTLHGEPTRDALQRAFAHMRRCGIDAVIPQVYDGHRAYWNSARLPAASPRLEQLLPLAAVEGLEVHAWMWCMPCMIPQVLSEHADWYNVNALGESAAVKPPYVDYYRFLDPARPEVRTFLRDIVAELADMDGLAGIHLDYIRYPDAILPRGLWAKYGLMQDRVYPQFDYGYTQFNRRAFERLHGTDPMRINDDMLAAQWRRYRMDAVSDLVNDWLVPTARNAGKHISAAVFPGPALARTMVLQDWGAWGLDGFMPMLYHSFYEEDAAWIAAQTREGASSVDAPIYAGLFVPAIEAPELETMVSAALAAGAAGVSLFDADAMDAVRWRALARSLPAP